jgi:hypothetical protein
MRKADNFDSKKWLVENKITTQSRLNENESFQKPSEDSDIESLKNFWYKRTKIDLKKFIKPYVREDFLLEKSGKMKYGF